MTPPPAYTLIRPETLVGVQKAIEAALGARAAECLAAGGRAGGVKATAQLEGDAASRAGRLLEAGREIGWGGFAPERPASPAHVVERPCAAMGHQLCRFETVVANRGGVGGDASSPPTFNK